MGLYFGSAIFLYDRTSALFTSHLPRRVTDGPKRYAPHESIITRAKSKVLRTVFNVPGFRGTTVRISCFAL